ncbi:MAG TPA: fibronectin type III domain-containing protein [Methylomirabilota bacterium]|nr:fibronectin type III domain-containing protein [Methylomirabilota bacterium]
MLSPFRIFLVALALLALAPKGWAAGGTVVAWGDNRTGQGVVPAGLNDVVAIAVGEWHNLALKSDGSLVAWGYNASVPHDLGKVVAVGAGGYHNMAVRPDGTIRAWGANNYGQINVPPGLTDVVDVKGGWVHSIALKRDGTVVGWGRGTEGQTTPPPGLTNVVAISSGEYHNLALRSDGTIVGWGYNGFGAVNIPAELSNNVVAVAAAGLHSMALKNDGTVVAWGWNKHGQTDVPAGLRDVIAIAGGAEHSLALKSDGTIVGWGANDGWASNDPSCESVNHSCPRKYTGQITIPAGLNNVVSIAAGVFHSVALVAPSAPQAPSAPGLSIASVTETSISLTWPDLPNEAGYRLESRVGTSGTWTEIATPAANATTFTHTRLSAGTTIYYRLRAFNNVGTSAYSAEVHATTQKPLPTPTLRLGSATHNQVNLQWDDVDGETGYTLERKTGASAWSVVASPAAGATAHTDTSVAASTTYLYRLRAVNQTGASAYSAELTATTPPPPLGTPTLRLGATAHNQVVLQWDDVASETGYTLERKTGLRDWIVVASPGEGATSFTDTTVNASATYHYRIKSFNTVEASPYSPEISVTTPAAPLQPPAAPTLTGTVASHNTLNLQWAAVASANEFRLERRTAGTSSWTEIARIDGGSTTHVDAGLAANTTYVYRLRASNSAGVSPYSGELSLTTSAPPLQVPVAPVLEAQATSHAQVALSWGSVENAASFTLQRRESGSDTWVTISSPAAGATSHVDAQVSPATAFTYRISASNAAGTSAYSAEVSVTTPAAPVQIPVAPTLQAHATSHAQVALTWASIENATGFTLQRREAGSDTWVTVSSPGAGATGHVDAQVTPSTAYSYRISASNSAGTSPYSAEVAVTTPAPPVDPATLTLQATAISPTQVRLEWNDVLEAEGTYTIEWRLNTATAATGATAVGADATNYTAFGLAADTAYVFRIRATGQTAWTEATVTTPRDPSVVQAAVNFVRVDAQTSGLWPLEFGTEGRWIASQAADLPQGLTVTGLPETVTIWAEGSVDSRALVGPGGTNRFAAGWSGGPLTFNLAGSKGTPRRIALYFVDWERTGATQQITIRDTATGTNLDTRSIEAFAEGKYLVYEVDGDVDVTINSDGGDAVLSGLFVGGGLPGPISNRPLTLTALSAEPNGNGLRIRINGETGQRFKVQRTTDFQTWTDVATSILLSPSTEMTLDGGATGFFRTVSQ